MKGIGQKTLSGLFSTGASKVVLVGANLLITGILANLLKPEEFGLVGMVTVFTTFLSMLGSLGFDSAIVQKQDISGKQMSTLFWVKVLSGVICATLLALGAYPISHFYKDVRLLPVTQCLSVLFLTSALYQSQRSLLRKELRFTIMAAITVGSVLGSGLVGVLMAYRGFGVWSLVGQALSLDVIAGICYWFASKWRPSFEFDFKASLPIIQFGLSMTGASFTQYLQRNIDLLLIGRLLGATPLGHYSLAYRLMYAPVRQISYIFTDVLFPAFSKLQDNLSSIRRGYRRCLKYIALVTFPAMTLVALHASDLIHVFIRGDNWLPSATLLAILAPAGAVQSLAQLGYVIFPVLGRPDLAFKLGAFNCVALAVGILAGIPWGAPGASFGILISTTVMWVVTETYAGRLVGLKWSDLMVTLSSSLLGSLWIVILDVVIRRTHWLPDSPFYRIALLSTLCSVVYGIWVIATEREEMNYLTGHFKETLARFRGGKSSSEVKKAEAASPDVAV